MGSSAENPQPGYNNGMNTQSPPPENAPQGPQPVDPRRRLRELLSVPERDRTDAQWDEIVELEIQLAPGNRIAPAPSGHGNNPPPSQKKHFNKGQGGGGGGGSGGGGGRQKPPRNKTPS